jgi:tellurium resistance protein TerD
MTLILTKNEPLNLSKNEPLARKIQIGAGWDFKEGKKIDLDLFAYTNTKQMAFFNQKKLFNGAIVCGGDSRDGQGSGVDEAIDIDLDKIPSDVTEITIALSVYTGHASYTGEDFDSIAGEFVQVKNSETNHIIAKTEGEINGNGKTLVFCKLSFDGNDWVVHTIVEKKPEDFGEFVASLGLK